MATQLKENTHADDDAFRTEVREFLAENFPEELKANLLAGLKIPTNETPLHTKWRESYWCSGLGTPTGPKAYGGSGRLLPRCSIWRRHCSTARLTT